jgi:uncharacterized protein (DUF433 family)
MRQVTIDPDICNGQPVFAGTRITAQSVVDFLAAGDSVDDILVAYPALDRDDVRDALRFSSRLLGHHFVVRDVA